MAPLSKLTAQLLLGYVSTNTLTQKPCHDTQSPIHKFASNRGPSVSAMSWGFNRMDIYGQSSTSANLTHQFWDGYQWGPSWDKVELLGGDSASPPTAVSADTGRMDIFSVGSNNAIYHKYYDGHAWKPSDTDFEKLGGELNPSVSLAATSWSANRLDVFGKGQDNSIYHTYYDGSAWQPQGGGLENLGDGTVFAHGPAAVSWGQNRIDVFAVNEAFNLQHQSWDGTTWLTRWEDLSGPELGNSPTAISWGENRLDIFGISTDGKLYHLVWDGSQWSSWENLGSPTVGLTGTVAATNWTTNRLDIVALGQDGAYYYKYWDGSQWQPSEDSFILKNGSFSSSPAAVSWGDNRLDIFGVGTDSMLKHQTWYGSGWYPDYNSWETLGGPLTAFDH